MKKILLLVMFCLAFTAGSALAQEIVEPPKPRLSPVAISRVTVNDTYIKVVYGQPLKKDRVIFGELEPYGKVWRTGANEATEITFTNDVTMGGKVIPAGTYSLFTIPGKDNWTVILNSGLGQFGAFQYDESLDVVRFDVPASESDKIYEAFTIRFEVAGNTVSLVLNWDNTEVHIPFQV